MQKEFSNNFDSPILKFEGMLKTNQVYFFDVQEFENIIHYYIDSGEINLANKALELAIHQHPYNTELTLLKTELLIFDGNLDEAFDILDSFQELEPNNQEIYIQKATIYSKKNKHTEAIKYLEQSLIFCDEPLDIWSLLGIEYMMLDDYVNAKKYFEYHIDNDIEDHQALYNILYCYDQLKEYKNSIILLNSILEVNPYNEIAWFELGKQYLNIENKEEALSSFDFAIISEEHFVGAYIEKGKVLEILGKIDEAIKNYKIALQLEDASSYLYYKIGLCYEKIKNNKAAVKYFKNAINLDPSNINAWNGIIDFYINLNNYKKAIYYLEKILKIDENNIGNWEKIGTLYKKNRFYSNAEKAFEKAISLGSLNYQTWIDSIDSLLFLNQWNRAQQVAKKAKKNFPSDYLIDYRLAGCYLKIGKTFEAQYYIDNFKNNNLQVPISIKYLFPEFSSIMNR